MDFRGVKTCAWPSPSHQGGAMERGGGRRGASSYGAPTPKHRDSQLCQVIVVQSLNCVRLFATPQTAACQASLFFTVSRGLLRLMSTESVMSSNHLILSHPFSSCLQPFPASGSFPVNWLFTSGGQSVEASASPSVLPMNIQS